MRKLKAALVLLTLVVIGVMFSSNQMKAEPRPDGCPVVVTCLLDGQGMMVEETYLNGIHISKKYGHDYYGPNGKVHHYVILSCQ